MLLQEKVQGTTLGSFWGCSGWGESVVSYLYLLFVPVISSDASVPSLGFLKQKQCFREMPPVKIWILRGWRTWEVEPWWLKGKELLVLERPAGSGAPAKQTASCVYYQWAHPFIHVLMTLSTNDFEYHVCLEIGSGATVKRKIEFLTSRNSWSRVGGRASLTKALWVTRSRNPLKSFKKWRGALLRSPGGGLLGNPRQEHGWPQGPESPQELRPCSVSPKSQHVPHPCSFSLAGLSTSSLSRRALALLVF